MSDPAGALFINWLKVMQKALKRMRSAITLPTHKHPNETRGGKESRGWLVIVSLQ